MRIYKSLQQFAKKCKISRRASKTLYKNGDLIRVTREDAKGKIKNIGFAHIRDLSYETAKYFNLDRMK